MGIVAWAFNAAMMRPPASHTQSKGPANPAAMLGKLTPIALHVTTAGTYTGTGTVMLNQSPEIIVTAEMSATIHTPTTPFWGVLVGSPMRQ